MSARPFYETVYHRNDWTVADAFRPHIGVGRKVYTVPVASMPAHGEDEFITIAKQAAPEGYRLTKVSVYPEHGAERILWSTAPDARLAKVTQGASHDQ